MQCHIIFERKPIKRKANKNHFSGLNVEINYSFWGVHFFSVVRHGQGGVVNLLMRQDQHGEQSLKQRDVDRKTTSTKTFPSPHHPTHIYLLSLSLYLYLFLPPIDRHTHMLDTRVHIHIAHMTMSMSNRQA